ncbi:hypothetical protein UL66_24310 [Shigella sonnei]|nr:hypothetical protein UL66_24310 [Shigella sonnei]
MIYYSAQLFSMCAFSYSTNCKEVNHDKSFINDSLQTFPGLILFFLPWIRLPFPDFLIVTLNNSSRSTCNLKYDESIYGMVHGQIYSSLIRCGIYHRI